MHGHERGVGAHALRGAAPQRNSAAMNGEIKTKLIETKKAWARAGRLLTGKTGKHGVDRLPPGQRLVENWPVLDLGVQPHVPREDWRLTVNGLVETEIELDWQKLVAEPQVEMVSDIHCVTQWSRYDNRWQGVSTRHLAELVKPKPEA